MAVTDLVTSRLVLALATSGGVGSLALNRSATPFALEAGTERAIKAFARATMAIVEMFANLVSALE